jgi:hypothetical protein
MIIVSDQVCYIGIQIMTIKVNVLFMILFVRTYNKS